MPRQKQPDHALLAGWLFADLLLALAVVVLGSAQGLPEVASAASTTTTTSNLGAEIGDMAGTTVVTTTTTAVVAPSVPTGVERTPVTFEVSSDYATMVGPDGPGKDAERARMTNEVEARLAELGRTDDVAALVLTFGVHPTTGSGERLADEFNQMIATGLPDRFGEAALRSFDYRSNEGVGTLRVEVYFLNR